MRRQFALLAYLAVCALALGAGILFAQPGTKIWEYKCIGAQNCDETVSGCVGDPDVWYPVCYGPAMPTDWCIPQEVQYWCTGLDAMQQECRFARWGCDDGQ
jgi:hypothetical protein